MEFRVLLRPGADPRIEEKGGLGGGTQLTICVCIVQCSMASMLPPGKFRPYESNSEAVETTKPRNIYGVWSGASVTQVIRYVRFSEPLPPSESAFAFEGATDLSALCLEGMKQRHI